MGNSLSKFNDKSFTFYTPPLTSGHLKKVASGIRNNPVKYFASGVHRNYGYEKFTQSIKSSLMDVYHRFHPQAYNLEWGNKVSRHIDRIAKGNDRAICGLI